MKNAVELLIDYAAEKKLIHPEDKVYVANRVLEALQLEDFPSIEYEKMDIDGILDTLVSYAINEDVIGESVLEKDLFDTKIMGLITPPPFEVIRSFDEAYSRSPIKATDYLYSLSKDVNYIRTARVAKDVHWSSPSPFGQIEMSINLSKPEKDPKSIALQKSASESGYPACALCKENEGYAGSIAKQARQNLRMVPVSLLSRQYYLQYSPYVYYNEHCIVLFEEHVPMNVNRETPALLLDFVRQFPHYFLGSNAGLPIVGGSILSHDHFQGGHHDFPMAKAKVRHYFNMKGFKNVSAGVLDWPVSVIRLSSFSVSELSAAAAHVFDVWQDYSDESVGIVAHTSSPHNAITPIARKNGEIYEIDLALRNNRTTAERPDGLFHPRKEYQHIKKENIGLIEVMGLAILPARLKTELQGLKAHLIGGEDAEKYPEIQKHLPWAKEVVSRQKINNSNFDDIFKEEIAVRFVEILKDAGVFKADEAGEKACLRLISAL